MKLWRCLLVGSLLGSASWQALACYTVYDRSSRVLYRSLEPPVDMSRPLHDALAQQFPGGHMVFELGTPCSAVAGPPRVLPVAPREATNSPMITDLATARTMGVPYTVMSGNIVLIQPQEARMRPGVNTLPRAAPETSKLQRSSMVITELRNPPMTIVETRDGTTISELAR
jgi:hypothetical protein